MKLTKTKIIASRIDDIMRDKAEYEAQKARHTEAETEAWYKYETAKEELYKPIIEAIKSALGPDGDNLKIEFRDASKYRISLDISNSNSSPRREDSASLTWSWNVTLDRDTGEIVKQSSSWSGLQATTSAQIDDLKKCVRQLEIINNLDWTSLLNINVPNYSEFSKDLPEISEDLRVRDFNRELFDAKLEECVGQRVLIPTSYNYDGRYYHGKVFIGIVKDSGSQYTIFEIPAGYVNAVLDNGSYKYSDAITFNSLGEVVDYFGRNTFRVKKDTIYKGVSNDFTPVEY